MMGEKSVQIEWMRNESMHTQEKIHKNSESTMKNEEKQIEREKMEINQFFFPQ